MDTAASRRDRPPCGQRAPCHLQRSRVVTVPPEDRKAAMQGIARRLRADSQSAGIDVERMATLLEGLASATALLWRRHAGEIPAGDLDAYVALQWMRWNGGQL